MMYGSNADRLCQERCDEGLVTRLRKGWPRCRRDEWETESPYKRWGKNRERAFARVLGFS